MKITRSQIIALIASLALILWFVLRNTSDAASSAGVTQKAEPASKDTAPTVLIVHRRASPRQQVLDLFGQSEANRQVSVKANTASVVIKTPLTEGQIVNKGDKMCTQIVNERDAIVEQTRAQIRQAQLEYDAALKLAKRGFSSETQVATMKAALDSGPVSRSV